VDHPRWLLPGALVVVGLLYGLGRLALGSGVGETCRVDSDCRAFWNARCMETGTGREKVSYCTRSCGAAGDCPDSWTCGAAILKRGNAFGDAPSMCMAPRSAPAPDPARERVWVLPDAGLELDRSEPRSRLSGRALTLAQRARDLHAADLARACIAIDVAQFDCREIERALGEAHAAAAHLDAAQRAQLDYSMGALDRAAATLCGGPE